MTTLAELLVKHHRPVSRVTLLDTDLATALAVLTPLDGSVTMDLRSDTHRQASFTVADPDGTLTDELLVEDRALLIERGAYLNDTPQMAQLMLGRISEDVTSLASGRVSVTALSRLSLLNRPWAAQTTFDAGVRLGVLGRTVAETAGYGTDDALYDLEDQGRALAVARTFDVGGDMLADLVGVFNDNGLDIWDTGPGVMMSRQIPDLSVADIAWAFAPNDLITAHDTRRTAQQSAINHVRVTGRGPDGYPIYGEAKITDASHPLYWTTSLDLPLFVDRPDVNSIDACLAVARQLLIDGSSVTVSHTLGAVPIPLLLQDGRPVVTVGGDRQRLDSVTMPLRRGVMQLSAKLVQSVNG